MDQSITEKIECQLMHNDAIDDWMISNENLMRHLSLSDCLNALLKKYKLSKREIITASGIDATYAYQIFQGKKRPGREHLLALAFGMGLDVRDTKHLLYYGGTNGLYPRNRRDAYIMYCLHNQYSLEQTNNLLFEHGEDTILKELTK